MAQKPAFDKLSINNEMAQLDTKNRKFYDQLTDEERKKFSLFLLNKYAANVEGPKELQEWYLRAANERANRHFFTISKHPKLQWLCCTTVSPNMGKFRHFWLAAKKREGINKSKVIKFLSDIYPAMKMTEIELLAEINDVADVKRLAKNMGMSDSDIKKALG